MKKILLIPASSVEPAGRLRRYLPLGLLSLRELALPTGPAVDLWLPSDELSRRPHSSSAELVEDILGELLPLDEYQAVGLSTMCSSLHHTLGLAQAIKERAPTVQVWLGGPHASVLADEIFEAFPSGVVDAIFVGEGEGSFAEALGRIGERERSLEGIAGVKTRETVLTPRGPIAELDELPLITFSSSELDLLRYRGSKKEAAPTLPLEVARGCPGRCTFCSTRRFWGKRVRHKSLERIVEEFRRYHHDTGHHRFEIMGDNLSASRPWLRKLCEAVERGAPQIRWQCDLKLERLRGSDLKLLWRAGCRGFFIGIESGSQATLDRICKEVDLDREIDLLKKALDQGFEVKASLIVGFPWEGPDDVAQTFALHRRMLKMGVSQSQIWLLCPLPGTDLIAEYEPRLDSLGSRIAMDGIPLDDETRELARRFPKLFVQLGRYETPNLDRRDVDATVTTAAQLNLLYSGQR